jgi:hypothetical protein
MGRTVKAELLRVGQVLECKLEVERRCLGVGLVRLQVNVGWLASLGPSD